MSQPLQIFNHDDTSDHDMSLFDDFFGESIKIFCNEEGSKKYKKLEKLGEGTYGNVYLATNVADKYNDDDNKKFVVIKQMKAFDGCDEQGVEATTIREISLLKNLNHQYIIKLIDTFITPQNKCCLVFEHCKQDLHEYMNQNKYNGLLTIKKIKVNFVYINIVFL